MALESEIYFDYGVNNAQKMMKVVDCRLVMDRDYDKHSPKSYMRLTRLDVTVSPDVDDMYLHKWFADKNSIDLLLQIVLMNDLGEEYQEILLKGATCCGLTERIDKVNPKKEKRRRLLTVGILADKVTVNNLELKYIEPQEPEVEARNQAPAQQQPVAPAGNQANQLVDPVGFMASMLPDTLTNEEKRAIAAHNIELAKRQNLPLRKPMKHGEARKTNPRRVDETIPNVNNVHVMKEVEKKDKNGRMVKVKKDVIPLYIKNPAYDEKKHEKFNINCTTCSVTYAMRLQGFDVTAKGFSEKDHTSDIAKNDEAFKVWKNADGTEAKPTMVKDWMKHKGYDRMNRERYMEFLEENTQEDGLYMFSVEWKGQKGEPGSCHFTTLRRWTDEKGTHLKNIETQTGNDKRPNKLCGLLTPWPDSTRGIMRVDNKLFNGKYADIFYK